MPVPLRSVPLWVNLAQSSAEYPGPSATLPFPLLLGTSLTGAAGAANPPPVCNPKSGFFVVDGGGAILPNGIASGMMAIFRLEGGSPPSDLVGDGGESAKPGAGAV